LPVYQELEGLFCAGGMQAECTERTEEIIWDKLCGNVMFNGMAALLQISNEDSEHHPDGWLLMRELARETCEVAQAKGIELHLEDYWQEREPGFVYNREEVPAFHYSSAMFDSVQKRQTEIDFLNGAIVKEGKKYGIAAPYNETVWRLVRVMQDNYDNKFKPR
jgi:2-dehydropantoate 2-reductase